MDLCKGNIALWSKEIPCFTPKYNKRGVHPILVFLLAVRIVLNHLTEKTICIAKKRR